MEKRHKMKESDISKTVREVVLQPSVELPSNFSSIAVSGFDFRQPADLDHILESFKTTGFQATNLWLAIEEVNRMLNWRLADEPINELDTGTEFEDPKVRANIRCSIWLAFTSNMVSSGLRDIFRFLTEHRCVDVIVTSAGGIEEDLIKCFAPTLVGSFDLNGTALRKQGLNRIGNLLVPNHNYCAFEQFIQPILDRLADEQTSRNESCMAKLASSAISSSIPESSGLNIDDCADRSGDDEEQLGKVKFVWTPSRIVERLGKEVSDERSFCYWCWRNKIPVFCPAITDGALGDNIFFHSFKRQDLTIDLVRDIRRINRLGMQCRKSGIIILGGGVSKHHVCNANLMRNGCDFAVYINTAHDFDGCDSGAKPDEAVSWGKIKTDATPVKVIGDATILFPLLVAATFAKHVKSRSQLLK